MKPSKKTEWEKESYKKYSVEANKNWQNMPIHSNPTGMEMKHDKGSGSDSLKKYKRIICCADCGANITGAVESVVEDARNEIREKIQGMKYPTKTNKKSKYIEFIGSNDSGETIRRWGFNMALDDLLTYLSNREV